MNSLSICPLLPEPMLHEYNFFELYPFDGGGSFIHHKYIRSLDDFEAAKNILSGAMQEFGTLPELDFARFERWSSIEQSCWINRMYFLVPLAKYAAIAPDIQAAETVCLILEHFAKNYPAPASVEEACEHDERVLWERDNGYNAHGPEYDAPVEYIWFDFQVASRIIHISHALWFLRNSPVLTETRRQNFMELLRTHARVIFYVEKFRRQPTPGNHQALRSLALLYACEIFKDEAESAQWLPVAHELCQFHILTDFLPDGMLNDLSPSYHFFESWIMRDMLTVAERNSWHFAGEVRDKAASAFKVCRLMRQPDGLSPVINDGYALDMTPFLKSVPEVPFEEKTILRDSGFALWNTPENFLLFDCSPLLHKLAHFHAGKMAPTLFMGGKPFLVDGGTCNYDDPEFSLYYKRSDAHSSLRINGKGDSLLQGRYTWLAAPEIQLGTWQGNTVSAQLQSTAPGWEGIRWQRSITVERDLTIIEDVVDSPTEIGMSFQFMLHHGVEVERSGKDLLLKNGDCVLRMNSTLPFAICGGLGFSNFKQQHQFRLVFNAYGCGGNFRIELHRER